MINKIIRKLGLRNFLKSLIALVNFRYSISINGKRFHALLLNGTQLQITEGWMVTLLTKLIPETRGGFLDVGVNIGQTLLTVKSIDADKTYIGFEPNPSCIAYCEKIIKINSLGNVDLLPVGLFVENKIESMDLFSDTLTNSGGSVIKDYWSFRPDYKVISKVNVPLMTYDTIYPDENYPPLGIVKIDVEGAELEVLLTLKDQIQVQQPYIIIEILPARSVENKIRYGRQESLVKLLKDLNYGILQIVEDDNENLKSIHSIDEFDISNYQNCNYILYHIDDKQQLIEALSPYYND